MFKLVIETHIKDFLQYNKKEILNNTALVSETNKINTEKAKEHDNCMLLLDLIGVDKKSKESVLLTLTQRINLLYLLIKVNTPKRFFTINQITYPCFKSDKD